MGSILKKVLNIEKGEGKSFFLFLIHSFSKGGILVLFETVANTKFLDTFSSDMLPLAYIGISVVSILIGFLYSKLENIVSTFKLLLSLLFFLIGVSSFFFLSITFSDSKIVIFLMFIWKSVQWILLGLEFWSLAGMIFDVRQGKRLFNTINSGEIIAIILSGFSIPFLLGFLKLNMLIIISVFFLFIYIFSYLLIYQTHRRFFLDKVKAKPSLVEKEVKNKIPFTKYLFMFFLLSFVCSLSYYFIDYSFYHQVNLKFTTPERLAGFFGIYYAILGIITLFTSLFISGRLILRYGIGIALLILPIFNFLGLSIANISIFSRLGFAGYVPWILIGTKLMDELFRSTFDVAANKILYQPLSPNIRMKTQTIKEMMVEPLAVGFSGAIIFLSKIVFKNEINYFLLMTLFVLLIWILVSIITRKEYTKTLIDSISNRFIPSGLLTKENRDIINFFKNKLESNIENEILFAIEHLEDIDKPSILKKIELFLNSNFINLKIKILKIIRDKKYSKYSENIKNVIFNEKNNTVISNAIETFFCYDKPLTNKEKIDFNIIISNTKSLEIIKSFIISVYKNKVDIYRKTTLNLLETLLKSNSLTKRTTGIRIIGEVNALEYKGYLYNLLKSKNKELLKETIVALQKMKDIEKLEEIWNLFDSIFLKKTIIDYSIHIGNPLLNKLDIIFCSTTNIEIKLAIIKIFSAVGGEKSYKLLKSKIADSDIFFKCEIYKLLHKFNRSFYISDKKFYEEKLLIELNNLVKIFALIDILQGKKNYSLIYKTMINEITKYKKTILNILDLIYDSCDIKNIYKLYFTNDKSKKSYAIEVIDNILKKNHKNKLFFLFDDKDEAEQLRELKKTTLYESLFENTELDFQINNLMTNEDNILTNWAKSSIIYLIGKNKLKNLYPIIDIYQKSNNPVLRETAEWSKKNIN